MQRAWKCGSGRLGTRLGSSSEEGHSDTGSSRVGVLQNQPLPGVSSEPVVWLVEGGRRAARERLRHVSPRGVGYCPFVRFFWGAGGSVGSSAGAQWLRRRYAGTWFHIRETVAISLGGATWRDFSAQNPLGCIGGVEACFVGPRARLLFHT